MYLPNKVYLCGVKPFKLIIMKTTQTTNSHTQPQELRVTALKKGDLLVGLWDQRNDRFVPFNMPFEITKVEHVGPRVEVTFTTKLDQITWRIFKMDRVLAQILCI